MTATVTNPIANARRAQAVALRAQADAIDAEVAALEASTPGADPWIPLRPKEPISGFGITGRCVIDAAARGEVETSKMGGKQHVRRSELERWATSRRKTPKARAERIDDAADDYEALVSGGGR